MEFKDRKGQHLNRKKLKIISQSPTELIVDMERFDDVEEEGTKIDAEVFNAFQTEITTANTNASNAVSVANSAKSESSLANSNSQTAVTTANSADAKAAQAVEAANTANTKSDSAVATANSANTKSDSAVATSNTALTKSEEAVATANAAKNESASANTNSSTALSNSQSAVQTANTANSTANTALTNSNTAIETANEAKTVAETVRGELADRGATVYVGEVAQPSIKFTSDPQSQIDNKIEKAKSTETAYSADDLLVIQKSGTSENYNLSLKTLTSAFLNAAFPVGSIYMSVSPTNPGTLFGGNWEAYAQGRTIFGAGTSDQTFSAGATGGESSHTLTTNEMPSHTHTQNAHGHTGNNKSFNYWFSLFAHSGNTPDADFHNPYKNVDNTNVTLSQEAVLNNTDAIGSGKNWGYRKIRVKWDHTPSVNNTTATNNNTGGGAAHNNLPPYIVTYAWKRIS